MWFIILTDLRKKKTEDLINRCKESIKKKIKKETSIYDKFQVDLE